ncbi:glycoside hydrolase family 73 protein [[Clostridium] dakarense]|uniref:glycoside hydrolase family 73 protein n=1 Tax=Faecalimicrobium dakarense TaxID=1301100 RepID=UPI0004B385CC|nr:glucosaminidase domain-containing protein [[Clostridium] dakarense]
MGKKKIKHLGKNKRIKNRIKFVSNKILITIGVLLSIYALFNVTKDIEDVKGKEEISITQEQNDFIKKIESGAKKNYKKHKILPSITVAQAILESGWGESELAKKSNNLFGIKADNSWDGEFVEVSTLENHNDRINAKFRKYNHVNESIYDHGEFLTENKRYEENGLFKAKNYKEQAQVLEDAGYSTKKDKKGNPVYADMLISVIKRYNLQELDYKI